MNHSNYIGNITGDLVTSSIPGKNGNPDTSVVRFSIACRRRFPINDVDTDFMKMVAFGKVADLIIQYCSKGDRFGCDCHFQNNNYNDKEGKKVYDYVFVVDEPTFLGNKKDQNNGGNQQSVNGNQNNNNQFNGNNQYNGGNQQNNNNNNQFNGNNQYNGGNQQNNNNNNQFNGYNQYNGGNQQGNNNNQFTGNNQNNGGGNNQQGNFNPQQNNQYNQNFSQPENGNFETLDIASDDLPF